MRPHSVPDHSALSVATAANATALPSRASKSISTQKAISILKTHASSYAPTTDVHRAFSLTIDTLQANKNESPTDQTVHPELRHLIIEQTERVLHKPNAIPTRSYATALNSSSATSQNQSNVPPRAVRELTIKPTVVSDSLKNATEADIVRETTRALGNPSASVIAARKLPSGEIHLTFASAAKRNLYEKIPGSDHYLCQIALSGPKDFQLSLMEFPRQCNSW